MQHAYRVQTVLRLEGAAMDRQPEGALMQRAAHGLSVVVARELARRRGTAYGGRVLILVGGGNNGGDALWAAARLARRGCGVDLGTVLGTPHEAGWSAARAAGARPVDPATLDVGRYDLVVDGILGIGGRPGLPDAAARLVERIRVAQVPIVAVDLPSGVSADTGACPDSVVHAARTVTFGVRKPCHLLEPAQSAVGALELIDIGLDVEIDRGAVPADLRGWEAGDVATAWPVPGPHSDKYARGVVGVDTGSEQYPGAALLSTIGTVAAGAGMVRFQGPHAAREPLTQLLPNVVHGSGRVQALLLGSGWGDRRDGAERVSSAVATGLPVVLDADALRYLPRSLRPSVLLTPHAGELARLLNQDRSAVEADPVAAARAGADRTGATVLLKGATQIVATPGDAAVDVAVPGPAWTAQAGSGDVLGGLCATLLAAGLPARVAGTVAASVQALTAAAYPGPLTPQDLARRVGGVVADLVAGAGPA